MRTRLKPNPPPDPTASNISCTELSCGKGCWETVCKGSRDYQFYKELLENPETNPYKDKECPGVTFYGYAIFTMIFFL